MLFYAAGGVLFMSGIVFFGTGDLDRICSFYTDRLDADIWLEQPGCTILAYDNMLFGFCERAQTDRAGIITFVYETREAVDEMADALADCLTTEPAVNEEYQIYNGFAQDPDGRTVEIQTFLHETPPISSG